LKRALLLWGPVVVYMAAIFHVSGLSEAPLPPGFGDKPSHSFAYAGLAVVIVRALSGGLPARVGLRAALACVLLAIAYGVTDEFHQSLVPGRSAELYDLYADAVGAIVGTAACWAWGIISLSPDPSTLRHAQGRPEQSRGTTRSESSQAKSMDDERRGASRHGL
jgi:VanZ family protein